MSGQGLIPRVQVVYLIGSGRSGTTLLSRILDLQDGYRAIGEIRGLTRDGRRNLPCGCGAEHGSCSVWGPFLDRLSEPSRHQAWNAALFPPVRNKVMVLLRRGHLTDRQRQAFAEVERVYRGLAGDGEILVDESKEPFLGFLLASQPWADVRFVELVRSPSDLIKSWQKPKGYIPASRAEVVARQWLRKRIKLNIMRRRLNNYWLRLPFTALVNDPSQVVQAITGKKPQGLALDSGQWVFESRVNHIFQSNADKLRRGPEVVRVAENCRAVPSSVSGFWERLACRYWNLYLRRHVELSSHWSPLQ